MDASTHVAAEIDPELLDAARAGRAEAVRALVAAAEPRLFGLALRLTRSRHAAEDLVQETFLRALGALTRYRGDGAVAHWLTRILVNLWRDQLRARQAPGALPDALPDELPAPLPAELDALARDDLQRRLEQALGQLSPLQRATILLRAREGFAYADIATALGISLESVKVHIHHARKRLGALLER